MRLISKLCKLIYNHFMGFQTQTCRVEIRRCKGEGAPPTIDVAPGIFVIPRGIIFCKVVKGKSSYPGTCMCTAYQELGMQLQDDISNVYLVHCLSLLC